VEKKLADTVAEVKAAHPHAQVEVWAADEHRIGLHPVNRMVWVPLGHIPIAQVNWKYQWVWLVGFVEPKTGQTYWWIVPKLNGQVFSQVLADFAAHFDLGPGKRVVLVLDQAAFHTTANVVVPEGIHLLFLPPKSPELQPAERLWPVTNEAIANRSFESLDQLEAVVAQRCRVLLNRPAFIQGLTGFHWWVKAVS
jgi:transposase